MYASSSLPPPMLRLGTGSRGAPVSVSAMRKSAADSGLVPAPVPAPPSNHPPGCVSRTPGTTDSYTLLVSSSGSGRSVGGIIGSVEKAIELIGTVFPVALVVLVGCDCAAVLDETEGVMRTLRVDAAASFVVEGRRTALARDEANEEEYGIEACGVLDEAAGAGREGDAGGECGAAIGRGGVYVARCTVSVGAI